TRLAANTVEDAGTQKVPQGTAAAEAGGGGTGPPGALARGRFGGVASGLVRRCRRADGQRAGLAARSAERPGMGSSVNFPQSIGRDQRVNLGGGHRCVPQQLLDYAYVSPAFQ